MRYVDTNAFVFDPPRIKLAEVIIAEVSNEELDSIVMTLIVNSKSTFAGICLAMEEAFWGGVCGWDRKIDQTLQRLRRQGLIAFGTTTGWVAYGGK